MSPRLAIQRTPRPSMLLLALALVTSLPLQRPSSRAADAPQANDLVRALFEADGWTEDGDRERLRIVGELERTPALDAAAVKRWTSKCLELFAKGRKIEKRSGRHFLWQKPDEKGLFFIGGESSNPKGLLLALHGGGVGSGDATEPLSVYAGAASNRNWLLLCPEVLEKTEHGWTDSGTEEFVLQLVDATLRTWRIDRDRVFFSGHSMGGYGTWTIGAHHADRVAALAPSAGAATPYFGASKEVVGIVEGIIPSLRNVPLAIFQSDDDPRLPPDVNRFAARALAKAKERWGGFEFEYWEVSGNAHDYPPGGLDVLLDKIDARVRDTRPSKVVWQPMLRWKRQFYWLYWSRPRTKTIVEASVDRTRNEVRVVCEGSAEGLEVLLDERLVDVTREVVVRLGDVEVFRGVPRATLSTLAKTALGGDPALVFSRSVPLTR